LDACTVDGPEVATSQLSEDCDSGRCGEKQTQDFSSTRIEFWLVGLRSSQTRG
jgi:hypothetical protein